MVDCWVAFRFTACLIHQCLTAQYILSTLRAMHDTTAVLCMENHMMRGPPGTRAGRHRCLSPSCWFPFRFPGSERKPEKETRKAEKGKGKPGKQIINVTGYWLASCQSMGGNALVWARSTHISTQLQKTVAANPWVAVQYFSDGTQTP